MRLNRRGFLGALGAAIAGATLDPERALWVPGSKLISIPAPAPPLVVTLMSAAFGVGDIVTIGADPQRFRVIAASRERVDLVRVDGWRAAMRGNIAE